jgi:hypothetical protein
MPSFDVIRSVFLHLLIGMFTGTAWAWSLTMSSRLEQRLGTRVPFAGGVGALVTLIVLLLGDGRRSCRSNTGLQPSSNQLRAFFLVSSPC